MIKCHFWQDMMNTYFNVKQMQFHTREDVDILIEDLKNVRPFLLTHKEFVKRQLQRKENQI